MEETEVPPVDTHDAGLDVELDVPSDVRPGEPTTLTVSVRDEETGELVDDLVRTHQVWMHLIVTRADLGTIDEAPPAPEVELDRDTIERALARANGVVTQAAAELGLSRQALYRRMERLGIARRDPG